MHPLTGVIKFMCIHPLWDLSLRPWTFVFKDGQGQVYFVLVTRVTVEQSDNNCSQVLVSVIDNWYSLRVSLFLFPAVYFFLRLSDYITRGKNVKQVKLISTLSDPWSSCFSFSLSLSLLFSLLLFLFLRFSLFRSFAWMSSLLPLRE